jgi:hypothetical protein
MSLKLTQQILEAASWKIDKRDPSDKSTHATEKQGFPVCVFEVGNTKKEYGENRSNLPRKGFRTLGERVYVMNFLSESGNDVYAQIKDLAHEDETVLNNIITLYRAYRGTDPNNADRILSKRASKIAMQSILQKLYDKDPQAAFYLGKMEWAPELINWFGFLDQVGDGPLGKFLGFSGTGELPVGKASGVGRGGLEDDEPSFDGDMGMGDMGEEPDDDLVSAIED